MFPVRVTICSNRTSGSQTRARVSSSLRVWDPVRGDPGRGASPMCLSQRTPTPPPRASVAHRALRKSQCCCAGTRFREPPTWAFLEQGVWLPAGAATLGPWPLSRPAFRPRGLPGWRGAIREGQGSQVVLLSCKEKGVCGKGSAAFLEEVDWQVTESLNIIYL